ncbi:hypothetical protein ACFYNO_20265 [Kitasatospora sp. NPDC006697]
MSASSDDQEAKIDAWVERHIARSPDWTPDQLASIFAVLGDGDAEPRVE